MILSALQIFSQIFIVGIAGMGSKSFTDKERTPTDESIEQLSQNSHVNNECGNSDDQSIHGEKSTKTTSEEDFSQHDQSTSGSTSDEKQIASQVCTTVTRKKCLKSYIVNFLEQRAAFHWLTQQFDRSTGSDHFQSFVVHSTFPANLNHSDFECYIDMMFNDFPSNFRTRMKNIFQQGTQNPISEDFLIDDHSDGAVSATLIQIIYHKNDRDELEMFVGSVTTTRRPCRGHRFNRTHWEKHGKQIKKALQYLYGKEALKELSED